MKMAILKHLGTKTLFSCRLLNKTWIGIASEILKSRTDLELIFFFSKADNGKTVILNLRRDQKFVDFTECFQNSKNFPFSRFKFHNIDEKALGNRTWTTFLSKFGKNIKGLKLRMIPGLTEVVLKKSTEKLRWLLLNRLNNLEEFGLDLSTYVGSDSSTFQLFPKFLAAQLPHLKVLYLNDNCFSTNLSGITTDLLKAAVNLERISSVMGYKHYNYVRAFPFFQSLGKLHCVQHTDLYLNPEILTTIKMNEKSAAPLTFKLKTLGLSVSNIYKNPSSWPMASVFLSNLFESSKDTLTELEMNPLGFLNDLQVPKFSKLNTLVITKPNYGSEILEPAFPPGIQVNHVFTALRSLESATPWTTIFPQSSIGSIPTLKSLEVIGSGMDEDVITQIGIVCPNLTDFKWYREECASLKNFPEVGSAIWTHLRKLQFLEVHINRESSANFFPAIDSCITGFSQEDCRRLQSVIKANKLVEEWGYQVHVPQSDLEPERKKPSILDLKDLEKLTLYFCCRRFQEEGCKECDLEKPITGVSEKYAFKLMEHLDYKIEY